MGREETAGTQPASWAGSLGRGISLESAGKAQPIPEKMQCSSSCLHAALGSYSGVLAWAEVLDTSLGVMPRPWEGAIAARVTHNQTPGPQNGTFPEQGWPLCRQMLEEAWG